MQSESIVVMEDGADWPAWVDQEAGTVSNVVVLARQAYESVRDFEARTEVRLTMLADRFAPQRGILVCGPDGGAEVRSCRLHLLHALAAIVRRAGGGEIVLVGDDESGLCAELGSFVERLNRRDASRQVSVRLRQPPAERVARVA